MTPNHKQRSKEQRIKITENKLSTTQTNKKIIIQLNYKIKVLNLNT
jgi:hypothetical protein